MIKLYHLNGLLSPINLDKRASSQESGPATSKISNVYKRHRTVQDVKVMRAHNLYKQPLRNRADAGKDLSHTQST